MERAFRFSLILAFTLLFANCAKNSSSVAPSGGPYSLSMSFTGMTPHIGQMMALKVIDVKDSSLAADTTITAVPSDAFQISFGAKLISGHSYNIDFWADLNKNGEYDPPPVDHAWRITLKDVAADTTVAFAHNTNFTDVHFAQSAMHSLTMSFTGMTPHIGQMLVVSVIDSVYKTTVADTMVAAVPSDAFTLTFGKKLIDGRTYNIDFWADLNKNGQYDAPPVDHAWRITLPRIANDTTVTFAHNTNFKDIGYPQMPMHMLTMSFMGMTPHIGQMLVVSVIDSVYKTTVADTVVAAVPSDAFTLTFGKKLIDGRTYNIDFWADLNKNGQYDAPPVDHAWRITLPRIANDTTVTFAHNTNFTDIGYAKLPMHSLTMAFSGMTPHIGQMMELWVVDSTYNSIVKDTVIAAVPADTFTLALGTILVDMRSYRVDFYADLNGNGKYDPPPVDHAWRIPLSDVVADTTIPFVHNTNFTDIAPY